MTEPTHLESDLAQSGQLQKEIASLTPIMTAILEVLSKTQNSADQPISALVTELECLAGQLSTMVPITQDMAEFQDRLERQERMLTTIGRQVQQIHSWLNLPAHPSV